MRLYGKQYISYNILSDETLGKLYTSTVPQSFIDVYKVYSRVFSQGLSQGLIVRVLILCIFYPSCVKHKINTILLFYLNRRSAETSAKTSAKTIHINRSSVFLWLFVWFIREYWMIVYKILSTNPLKRL